MSRQFTCSLALLSILKKKLACNFSYINFDYIWNKIATRCCWYKRARSTHAWFSFISYNLYLIIFAPLSYSPTRYTLFFLVSFLKYLRSIQRLNPRLKFSLWCFDYVSWIFKRNFARMKNSFISLSLVNESKGSGDLDHERYVTPYGSAQTLCEWIHNTAKKPWLLNFAIPRVNSRAKRRRAAFFLNQVHPSSTINSKTTNTISEERNKKKRCVTARFRYAFSSLLAE